MSIDIGDVISATGLPASTLHVWESRGLIAPEGRRAGRRQFPDDILDRIAIIALLQQSDFRLDEIAELLEPGAFADGKQALAAKLESLQERRRRLDRSIEGLQHALHCPEPSPFNCDGFKAHLSEVLPVDPETRSPTAP